MSQRKPILYGTVVSPTVKAVLFTLKALEVDFEFRIVNPMRGENLLPDYIRKNPAHTIPLLEDGPGRFIGDSHAIMAYLVGKYGKDDKLYPKDLYKRAIVDQRLHFENGVLFISCVKQVLGPIFAGIRSDVPKEKIEEIEKAYEMLENFLGNNDFVAAEHMTIADFSCFTSIISMYVVNPINEERYPKLIAWLERMRQLPSYEEIMVNENSLNTANFIQKKLSKL